MLPLLQRELGGDDKQGARDEDQRVSASLLREPEPQTWFTKD